MPRKSPRAHRLDDLRRMLRIRLATMAARELESSNGSEDSCCSDELDMDALVAGALEETIHQHHIW